MSTLITWGVWTTAIVWSLLCWAALGLIDLASGLASGSTGTISDVLPMSESFARSLIDLADDLGEVFVVLVWLGGVVLILGGGALVKRFIAGAQRLEASQRRQDGIVTLKREPGQDHWKA